MVDLPRDLGVLHQRCQLRGEADRAIPLAVEERLLADAVTGQQQLVAAAVPQCEREHPVQLADAVRSELLVEVDDDLGVTVGGEAMAVRPQPAPELTEVVDLAVQHDGHGAILVVDRLVAGHEVDDPQPLDPEADPLGEVQPPGVRPAVDLCLAHALERLPVHRRTRRPSDAGYAAHGPGLSARRPRAVRAWVRGGRCGS